MAPLTPKARVFILIDEFHEFFQRFDQRRWLVAVPFEVAPLPKNTPSGFSLHEGSLRHRVLQLFIRLVPTRSDFKYLDALPRDPEPKIELRPDVWCGAPTLNECADDSLTPLPFKFAQRHFGAI